MNIKWVKVDKEWGNNKQLSHIMIMMIPWIACTAKKSWVSLSNSYEYINIDDKEISTRKFKQKIEIHFQIS